VSDVRPLEVHVDCLAQDIMDCITMQFEMHSAQARPDEIQNAIKKLMFSAMQFYCKQHQFVESK
jgi:hypothetical protein